MFAIAATNTPTVEEPAKYSMHVLRDWKNPDFSATHLVMKAIMVSDQYAGMVGNLTAEVWASHYNVQKTRMKMPLYATKNVQV